MKDIILDYANGFVSDKEILRLEPQLKTVHRILYEGKDQNVGWLNYPNEYDRKEFEMIKESAKKVRSNSEAFIVIGIGGSYLGSRAVIESLSHSFYDNMAVKRNNIEIYFVGNNISGTYLKELMDVLEGKDISINVISKSGSTLEPAIAFRIFKEYMERKYGKKNSKERIYITTDKEKGVLSQIAEEEGYNRFTIPNDIGGRYSVFTPVGIFPIAVAGIDIDKLMEGAQSGVMEYSSDIIKENISYIYGAIRNILYRKGKEIEILVSYEPRLFYLQEWWKQLFGESEGKDGRGIYPSSLSLTTDLHSMGQLVQDGRRNMFETVLNVISPREDIVIQKDEKDLDNLNFLVGKSMDFVNKKAFEGTLKAHVDGGVPNLIINIPKIDEYFLGKLMYFFQKSCAVSGYLLGVNPFDQPGVEKYKKNMFELLRK